MGYGTLLGPGLELRTDRMKPLLIPAFMVLLSAGCRTPAIPDAADLQTADEMEGALRLELFERWYPAVVDSVHGGFLTDLDYRWQPAGPHNKLIVTQARHLWTLSEAARFFSAQERLLPLAAHGFRFLRDVLWDSDYGGFFQLVEQDGKVLPDEEDRIIKTAYGNAFGIYGLAAYYRASADTAALDLARKAFLWLESHSHDAVHGGYYQYLARDGAPMRSGYAGIPPKDQNSSIHLLEAFTELYQVWPDPLVGMRLEEMLRLIRDVEVAGPGYLQLFFSENWTPVSYRDSSEAVRKANEHLDHVSFGHDVETAFLMLEASETLGLENDATTERVARRMVDHALRTGWDVDKGGFFDRGYYPAPGAAPVILSEAKIWWAEAEGLNTLLMMADKYGNDPVPYRTRFHDLWTYTKTYLLDPQYGGWYAGGLDIEPHRRYEPKAGIWKGNYHTSRALMRCIRRLRS